MIAVAKESVNYWMEQLKNPESPWMLFYDKPLTKVVWLWRKDAQIIIQWT